MINVSGVLLKLEIGSNAEKPFARAIILSEDNEPIEILTTRSEGMDKLLSIKDQVNKNVTIPVKLPRSIKQLWV